jgi:ubiquinone/menaquinone biosynthesis C-methylase UbiE
MSGRASSKVCGTAQASHQRRLPWAVQLCRKSVLKQEKFREIERLLPPLGGKICLDIGGDNGVISYLLREKGGTWHSADSPEMVDSIRDIVGENVHGLDGPLLPFDDGQFDLVVVIDYIEHIEEDRLFVRELFRVLKLRGELIVNVPHAKGGAILRSIRLALGLTDEWHGHVRPGYTEGGLRKLLGDLFTVQEVRTYSRFFSHLIDTAFAFVHSRLGKGRGKQTSKGVVVTQKDFEAGSKAILLSSLLYPLCRLLVQFNWLLFFTKGYLLLVRTEKNARGPDQEAKPGRNSQRLT